MSDPLETGDRAWCPSTFCGTLGKRVQAAYDEHGYSIGGRLNRPTFVCPRGHGWTIGQEEASRVVLDAIALHDSQPASRRRRPLVVVP